MTNSHQLRNSGFVLIVSMAVILLLSGIVVLVLSNSIVKEAKKAQYEIQSEQAYHAANAGLEYAIIELNSNESLIFPYDDAGDTLSNGASYSYSITANSLNLSGNVLDIVSTGLSSDGLATRTVSDSVVEIVVSQYSLAGSVDGSSSSEVNGFFVVPGSWSDF